MSEPESEILVIGVDPGRSKCGLAVVGSRSGALARAVVAVSTLADTVRALVGAFAPSVIVVGGGTGAKSAKCALETMSLGIPIETVDEKFTSLDAKARFFKENPPRGLRRLIPVSLQTPRVPYDDYVAVLLAERYIAARQNTE